MLRNYSMYVLIKSNFCESPTECATDSVCYTVCPVIKPIVQSRFLHPFHCILLCKRTALFLDPFSVFQNIMNVQLQKSYVVLTHVLAK